jgi:hypothetical protein
MSAEDGSITLQFGDADYTFRIAFGQWRELQETVNAPRLACNHPVVGPMELLQLLNTFNAWPHDVREVIRLGLIGGGMKPDRALVLVKRYVEGRPHGDAIMTARVVLHIAMFGPPDDQTGKAKAPARPEATASDLSGSQNSTVSALQ